jgi:hypothetical protein
MGVKTERSQFLWFLVAAGTSFQALFGHQKAERRASEPTRYRLCVCACFVKILR